MQSTVVQPLHWRNAAPYLNARQSLRMVDSKKVAARAELEPTPYKMPICTLTLHVTKHTYYTLYPNYRFSKAKAKEISEKRSRSRHVLNREGQTGSLPLIFIHRALAVGV